MSAFEAQVRALPQPVTVVAHSLGGWITWDAVSAGRAPGVTRMVLVGAYPAKDVGYPATGSGQGTAGRGLLGLTAWLSRKAGFSVFDPAAPASADWLADPARLRQVFARPLPSGIFGLGVSSRGESHPPALVEPDVSLSTHPAPLIPPCGSPPANGRTGPAAVL